MAASEGPSKTQINKCGKLLQQILGGDLAWSDVPHEELNHAITVVNGFRSAHAYPMLKVRMGLQSFCCTEGAAPLVTQRLKRFPRIIGKLVRMRNSSLARIEDIGGCRAILSDGRELDRVRGRLERVWGAGLGRSPRDYIETPKEMGYRAVHFVVERDNRAIEVQLRTRGQQQWAEAVEAVDARLNLNLKDSQGPEPMREYFAVTGEVIYLREYQQPIPTATLERFAAARAAVIEAGYYSA